EIYSRIFIIPQMSLIMNTIFAQLGKLTIVKLKDSLNTNPEVKKFLAKWDLLSPKDDLETIYFKAAFEIYQSGKLSEDLLSIILHQESIDAIKLSNSSSEKLLFQRALDDQLHRSSKIKGVTKQLEIFPRVA